jgi:hypothetical protein
MNCVCVSGINDCHWNVDSKCTSYEVTRTKQDPVYSRDWDSKQNCTLTQIGVHMCGAYLPEGSVYNVSNIPRNNIFPFF